MRPLRLPGRWGDVVVVLAGLALLGALCGVLWWLLADPAVYTKMRGGEGAMGEIELSHRFDADGWYSVLATVAGFLAGMGLTWWRCRDVRLTTLLLLPGGALAAAVMALVGRVLGPENADRALAAANPGDRVATELVVSADAVYLLWPIAALFGALMVLWSAPGPVEEDRSRIPRNHERSTP
ncbi:MAG: hypothetical protein ACRDPR_11760 [Nocardioidaceae bacterium]